MASPLKSVEIEFDGICIGLEDKAELKGIADGHPARTERLAQLTGDAAAVARRVLLQLEQVENIARYGPKPSLTVDGILFVRSPSGSGGDGVSEQCVVLIRRGHDPHEGMWALPGGFVEYGESVEDAVVREMEEETRLRTRVRRLVGVYSKPGRDPRWQLVTVAFELELIGDFSDLQGGDDAAEAKIFPISSIERLAFDHREILDDALRRTS